MPAWTTYAHLGVCVCGSRLTPVLHQPVKMVLLAMLRSVFPASNVLDGDAQQMRGLLSGRAGGAWWTYFSTIKRPDIIIVNHPRVGVHTIIDVKTFDATTSSHIHADHTDFFTLGAHRELERSLIDEYITMRDAQGRVTEIVSRGRAIGQNDLICAAVSRQGAIGEKLMNLIKLLAGMHAQRARDGMTSSFNFERVWRHRLSLCVHSQASTRLLALLSEDQVPGVEIAVELPRQHTLESERGTASWLRASFAEGMPEEVDGEERRSDSCQEEEGEVVAREEEERAYASDTHLFSADAVEERDVGDAGFVAGMERVGDAGVMAGMEGVGGAGGVSASDAPFGEIMGPHRPPHSDALSSGPMISAVVVSAIAQPGFGEEHGEAGGEGSVEAEGDV